VSRSAIAPVVWQPPPASLRAKAKTGRDAFPPLSLLPLPGVGPEDVVVDGLGRVLTGLEDGRILRVAADGAVSTVGNTGGRPLGLEVLPDGRVLVCDSHRGLLRLDPSSGALDVLVGAVEGVPLRFCSNAVAALDGTVYFTESTRRFGFEEYRADVLEHSSTGRLFRLSVSGEVETLLDHLDFANGVALAADESYVVVAETTAYRLLRYWLTGPLAGTAEPWVTNLAGFPDNISRGPSGLLWVAIPNPRDARLDALLPRAPWLRRLVWAVPEALQPQPTRTIWVIGVDASGAIARDYQVPGERFAFATGVVEHAGRLYLGSITERAIAVLDL
jgi:sugar lactone lactonase YvrE